MPIAMRGDASDALERRWAMALGEFRRLRLQGSSEGS